ncbi:MAG: P-loop NTPase [Promethearchaeota archaeon]
MNNNKIDKQELFKIGIISGKGGVGKTTISGSLSVILNRHGYSIIAADCDVDAPNLGLLFKTEQITNQIKIKTTEKSFFSEQKCVHCKKCIDEDFCVFHALTWDLEKEIPVIDYLACEGCGACFELCPEKAFELKAVDSGMLTHETSIYGFPLVWGETELGASTSGKLVTEIKEYISNINGDNDSKILILDGPPGIGCPVIATVTDLDFVIVVIEPTSTALHDAERAISVLNQINREYGIVINKADAWEAGYKSVIEYADKNDIKIIGEIPVDNAIPNATVKGVPVFIDAPDSTAGKALKKIYEYLIQHVIPEK